MLGMAICKRSTGQPTQGYDAVVSCVALVFDAERIDVSDDDPVTIGSKSRRRKIHQSACPTKVDPEVAATAMASQHLAATQELAERVRAQGTLSAAARAGIIPSCCLTVSLKELQKEEDRIKAGTDKGEHHMDTPLTRGVRSYLNPVKLLMSAKMIFKAEHGNREGVVRDESRHVFVVARALLSLPTSNAGEERKLSTAKAISLSSACPATHGPFSAQVVTTVAARLGNGAFIDGADGYRDAGNYEDADESEGGAESAVDSLSSYMKAVLLG